MRYFMLMAWCLQTNCDPTLSNTTYIPNQPDWLDRVVSVLTLANGGTVFRNMMAKHKSMDRSLEFAHF